MLRVKFYGRNAEITYTKAIYKRSQARMHEHILTNYRRYHYEHMY